MGSPTAKDNTFGEALAKFGTKAASDLAELSYVSDADDSVIAALNEAIQTIVQSYMRSQYNGAQAQGGGIPAQPTAMPMGGGAQGQYGGGPSFAGQGLGGVSQGYGDGLGRSMSRMT